ncbi:MAG: hypothetical protein NUW07_08130, partial [Candidatus Saccharicenans sp.]|nr:hypothetical protein [Candidatus Saccharicenans sp.]
KEEEKEEGKPGETDKEPGVAREKEDTVVGGRSGRVEGGCGREPEEAKEEAAGSGTEGKPGPGGGEKEGPGQA